MANAGRDEWATTEAGFVQIRAHSSRVAPPEMPETFSGPLEKKGSKSTGVIALMEQMQGELKSDMAAAEADEKAAQQEYEELMEDSAQSRAQNAKSITEKEHPRRSSRRSLRRPRSPSLWRLSR